MKNCGEAVLGTLLAALLLGQPAFAGPEADVRQSDQAGAPPKAVVPPAPRPKPARATSRMTSGAKLSGKAQTYYAALWGVDNLKAAYTASGNLIRFTYRVVDPVRAKVLADRAATPYLVCPRNQVLLTVPVMEKVGPLRQAEGLEAGRDYWMAFSNKGQLVTRGDRVDVVVGTFRVDGLVVE